MRQGMAADGGSLLLREIRVSKHEQETRGVTGSSSSSSSRKWQHCTPKTLVGQLSLCWARSCTQLLTLCAAVLSTSAVVPTILTDVSIITDCGEGSVTLRQQAALSAAMDMSGR